MKRKIQKENLAGKSAFEIWADTFGFKIERYHSDNGIFSKQVFRSDIKKAFRSEIDYTNQNITFCGVGYHHQNANFERKNSNSNTRS